MIDRKRVIIRRKKTAIGDHAQRQKLSLEIENEHNSLKYLTTSRIRASCRAAPPYRACRVAGQPSDQSLNGSDLISCPSKSEPFIAELRPRPLIADPAPIGPLGAALHAL